MENKRIVEEQVNLLNGQIITSVLFIISILISILLAYDDKQNLLHKQSVFDKDFDKYLNLFNRIFALIIILVILYLNYIGYQIGQKKGSRLAPLEHQIIASIFAVISGIIVLYVVIENWDINPTISNIENPII